MKNRSTPNRLRPLLAAGKAIYAPDATRGFVKGLGADDARRVGLRAMVMNTFHLMQTPGISVVKALGGLHAFTGWDGPIMTDSGGFQVFSLMTQRIQDARLTKDGFTCRDGRGNAIELGAAKTIELQLRLGSDAVVCLDHCTHPDAPVAEQRASIDNTIRWAREARTTFDRLTADREEPPLLVAVVQGGRDPALRRECAERLLDIGFDAYGYGGWPIDDDGQPCDEVALVAELLPPGTHLWGLGIGSPDNIVHAWNAGYRIFDCALPTRDARRGRLLVTAEERPRGSRAPRRIHYAYLPIEAEDYVRDGRPVSADCDCDTCANYSRGYLHHLFNQEDALATRLATLHNLRFYQRLLERLEADNAETPPG